MSSQKEIILDNTRRLRDILIVLVNEKHITKNTYDTLNANLQNITENIPDFWSSLPEMGYVKISALAAAMSSTDKEKEILVGYIKNDRGQEYKIELSKKV